MREVRAARGTGPPSGTDDYRMPLSNHFRSDSRRCWRAFAARTQSLDAVTGLTGAASAEAHDIGSRIISVGVDRSLCSGRPHLAQSGRSLVRCSMTPHPRRPLNRFKLGTAHLRFSEITLHRRYGRGRLRLGDLLKFEQQPQKILGEIAGKPAVAQQLADIAIGQQAQFSENVNCFTNRQVQI
jgi:hypothetical protein